MGPEVQAYISGMFAGQQTALVLLVKVLHKSGTMDGHAYVQAIKGTFNQPDAQFDRQSYVYLQKLANFLEDELTKLDR